MKLKKKKEGGEEEDDDDKINLAREAPLNTLSHQRGMLGMRSTLLYVRVFEGCTETS